MERNMERELDELKQDMRDIKEALSRLLEEGGNRPPVHVQTMLLQNEEEQSEEPIPVGHVQKMPGMHSDPHIMAILDRLEDARGSSGSSGRLAYLGVYSSGGRQSTWTCRT